MPDSPPSTTDAPLMLDRFLPYRLAVLANTVSKGIARLYAERFGITIPEWRILAILGAFGPATASEIQGRSAMDKVQVSRAIARLTEAALIQRTVDPDDRRRQTIAMTAEGERVYREIVPLARSREAALLEGFTPEEREMLDRLLDRLQTRAAAEEIP
ncbi:MAG: MarR family winged helix-turn-helix transcriptional regulator [Alphaproteobacteria bacterium]|nr:MarR family winged helix-turn-helix transcriptional regulator [Alphaproteobacteria bacterium]